MINRRGASGGIMPHNDSEISNSMLSSSRLNESTGASDTAIFIDRVLGSDRSESRDNGRKSMSPINSSFSSNITSAYQTAHNSFPYSSSRQFHESIQGSHDGKAPQPHSSEASFGMFHRATGGSETNENNSNRRNVNSANNPKPFKAFPFDPNSDRDMKKPNPSQFQHSQNSTVNTPLIQVPVTEAILGVQDNCAIRGLTSTSAWLGELYLSSSVTPMTSHGIEPTQTSNPITGEVLEPIMSIPVSCLLSADLSIHSEYYYSPVEIPHCDFSRDDDTDESASDPTCPTGGASALRAEEDVNDTVNHSSSACLTTPCRQSYFYQPPSGGSAWRPQGEPQRKSGNISQQGLIVPTSTDPMTGPYTRDGVGMRSTSTASNSSYALAPIPRSSSKDRQTHTAMVLSSDNRGEYIRGGGDEGGTTGRRSSAHQVSFVLRSASPTYCRRLAPGVLTPHNSTIPPLSSGRKGSPHSATRTGDHQGPCEEGDDEFIPQPTPVLAPFHHRALLATAKAYFDQGEYRRAAHTLRDLPVACVLGTRLVTSGGSRHDCDMSNGACEVDADETVFQLQDEYVDLSRQSITRTDRRAAFLCAYAVYKDGEKAKRAITSGTGGGAATALGITSNNPNLKELLVMLKQSALQDFPDDGYLRWLYGVVLRESSRPQEAVTAFVDSVLRNPLLWCAWEDLSKEVTHISDMAHIIAEYSSIFHCPAPGGTNYNNGSAPVVVECPFVKEIFAAKVFLDLKYPLEAHIEIDKILRKRKTHGVVSVPSGPAVAIVDSNPALLLLTGYLHNMKRDYHAAIRVFDELHLKYPNQLEGMDEYANALYMVGDRFTLCTLAQECYTVDPFRAESNIVAANYYSALKRHDRSLYHFRRATQIDPYLTSAWTLLGHEYIEAKNPSAAAQAYRAAIRIDRRDYRPWYGLGRIYELQQMSNYAITYFWEAVTLNPGDFRMWSALAACFERLRMPEDMTYCLEKIVSNFEESELELETRRRNVAETGSLSGNLGTSYNTTNSEMGRPPLSQTGTPSPSILFAGRVLKTATTVPEEAREHYKTCRLLVLKYTSWNPDKAAYYIQKMLASPYCTAADTVGFLPGLIQYFLAKATEGVTFGAVSSARGPGHSKPNERDARVNNHNNECNSDDDDDSRPTVCEDDLQGPTSYTPINTNKLTAAQASYLESAEIYLERLQEYASSEEGIDEAGVPDKDGYMRSTTHETVYKLQNSITLIKNRLCA